VDIENSNMAFDTFKMDDLAGPDFCADRVVLKPAGGGIPRGPDQPAAALVLT
jgi:hypothetical protein